MGIFSKEYECLSRSEMENLQSERLRKLVKRVYENVPFYKGKFDELKLKPEDIKSVGDLAKLPFTVKTDLRDNYPLGLLAVPKSEIARVHASSGTTGKPTVVAYTKNDIDMWAEITARCLAMAGATKDSTVQISYGYGLFTGGLGAHYGSEKLGALTVPSSVGNTQKQIMLLKDFQTDVIMCTPSYAIYLAEEMEKMGMDLSELNLKAGVFGAEPWGEAMKADIESRLKIKAHNIYGLSEIIGPGVSGDCEFHCGSHISEDHFIPEIIDPDTLEPLPYGSKGELVFTTITKEGMPLIRYRTHDVTSLNVDKCQCGRTTVRMNGVMGRSDDMLIIRGINVFPSQIETVLVKFKGELSPHYQIVITRDGALDNIEIQVEMAEKLFTDQIKAIQIVKNEVAAAMSSILSIKPNIRICEPNTLPRTEGKAKRIVDLRQIK